MHSLFVGGLAPKGVSRGVGRVQGAQSMTNQHPERAARWAFWIICGSGRSCQWPTNRNKAPLGEHCGRHVVVTCVAVCLKNDLMIKMWFRMHSGFS